MRTIHCAICGDRERIKVLYPENFDINALDKAIFSARRVPDKVHYRLVKCLNCGLIFSNPILEQEKIDSLYRESEVTYDAQIPYLQKTYGKYLRKVKGLMPKAQRILEIGCGNGFFLEEAKRQGFSEVYGVEPGKPAAAKAKKGIREKITVDIFRKGQFPENFFDIVCFFQTIDHIPEPNSFLRAVFEVLKPGGLVFCICHNTSAFGVKMLGERSPIFDIEHIYLFNPRSLKKIFLKNGFTEAKTFTITNIYPLSYWLRMLPVPGKKGILRLLTSHRRLNPDMEINAGNMGIIAAKSMRNS